MEPASFGYFYRFNLNSLFFTQVEIDRHPVRFYVYKRPHVDYFLDLVRAIQINK